MTTHNSLSPLLDIVVQLCEKALVALKTLRYKLVWNFNIILCDLHIAHI